MLSSRLPHRKRSSAPALAPRRWLRLLLLLWPMPALATPLETAARAFAREEFAEVLKQLPSPQSQAEASLLRARALLQLGRHAEAERALEALVSQLPEVRDLVLFLRAEALSALKRHQQAADLFRETARSRGSRFIHVAWQRRAAALLAARQWSAAAKEYRHLLKTQSGSTRQPEWELSLALCQEKLGQKREAATVLRELWLQHPIHPAGDRAGKELERLLGSTRLRLKPLTLARRLGRILLLRKEKRYPQTLEELEAIRKTVKGEELARVDLETALVLIWANRPADALPVLRGLPAKTKVIAGWHRRALIASCLARTGKVEEAAQLLLAQSYHETGTLRPHQRAEVSRAAKLLADHGRYAEALKLRLRLAPKGKLDADTRLELGWLSYRSGQYPAAIQHLETWSKLARGERDFAMYWLARAQARAGQPEKAEALYRELLEKRGATYYGLLARTRLVEAGKLPRGAPGRCTELPSSVAERHTEVLTSLAALEKRHGHLLPELRRAHLLWRLGMTVDARRELRLLAIQMAWVASRGKPSGWIQRPSVERLWRGGPLEKRRYGKTERELAKEGPALRESIGLLLQAAGISYFGWQLGAPDPDPERRRNPRAYPELVQASASRFKLDPNLLWAIMRTESSYRLDVISRVGATGLMQIMPHTGRRIAAALNLRGYEHDQLFEPETNLTMAAWYLRALSDKFSGQVPLIAAGYNGGPHHVGRWLEMRGSRAEMDEFIEEIPFDESRRYAKKILRLVRLYERIYCKKEDRLASNKLDPRFLPDPDF